MSLFSLLLAPALDSLPSAACGTLLLESALSVSTDPVDSASADKLSSTLSSLEVVALIALVEVKVVVVVMVSTGEEDVVETTGEGDVLVVSDVSGKLAEGAETSDDNADVSEGAGTISASAVAGRGVDESIKASSSDDFMEQLGKDASVTGSVLPPLLLSTSLVLTVTVSPTAAVPPSFS